MHLCQSRRSQFPSSLKGNNRNIRTVDRKEGRGGEGNFKGEGRGGEGKERGGEGKGKERAMNRATPSTRLRV